MGDLERGEIEGEGEIYPRVYRDRLEEVEHIKRCKFKAMGACDTRVEENALIILPKRGV